MWLEHADFRRFSGRARVSHFETRGNWRIAVIADVTPAYRGGLDKES
jgi:hypothetical protein